MNLTHRRAGGLAAVAVALLAVSACSSPADPPREQATSAAPAATASATESAPAAEFPPAVARDLDLDFGSTHYERFAACHHDGPLDVEGGRGTVAPSDPSPELTELGAEVEVTITGAPTFLEIGPDGRSYASVPYRCDAVGGDAPDGAAAVIDSGAFIAGGTQEAMSMVGYVSAGDVLDGTDALQQREPAGIGTTLVHSSLRNGDGYRYYVQPERPGDTDEPSGAAWTTVHWDDAAGSVRQLAHSEDLLETVPRPDETLVVAADGDDGIILGREDLDDRETFDAISEFLGEPDKEEDVFAEEGAHHGYTSTTRTWDEFTVTLYSPADGEPDWVGTCLAWRGSVGRMPSAVTVGSPVQPGSSLEEHPAMTAADAPYITDGESPGLIDDGTGRYTIDVVGGTANTGMIDWMMSGTGCARN